MFRSTTWYGIQCDAPGCVRVLLDGDDQPVLVRSPDLDLVDPDLLADDDGTPWTRANGERILCPGHGHLAAPAPTKIHLEALDADGQLASYGLNAVADAVAERRDGQEVTVLTMRPGHRLSLLVAPHGRGRPRTITHIRVSTQSGELARVPLAEPRRFARPGAVEVDTLRVEIDGTA
ncbi:hypothetical protein ACIRPH_31525 [Nocardiopsis sp. NPDC101807]|uniref:hypothetical protein n=1 Tax=Nocardiopsis sp. NPDC101807 TaxID=3364339 RepID=UPI00382E9166